MATPSQFRRELGVNFLEVGSYIQPNDQPTLDDYRQMRRGDPTIGSAMRSIERPILAATYDVVPPKGDLTPAEEEMTEVIRKAILESEYINFKDTLTGLITFLTYGFSIQEIVLDRVGRFDVPVKLGFRPQTSIEEPIMNSRNNKGQLVRLVQTTDKGRRIFLPREKLMICSNERTSRDDWKGKSILENTYEPWFRKVRLENVVGAAAERWVFGIPVITLPPMPAGQSEEFTANARTAIEALESLQDSTNSKVVLPSGYEIKVLEGPRGQIKEVSEQIKDQERKIFSSVLVGQVDLSEKDEGQAIKFYINESLKSVESWAKDITDTFNEDLIKTLVKRNWPNETRQPKMTVKNILNNYVINVLGFLIQSGAIKTNRGAGALHF